MGPTAQLFPRSPPSKTAGRAGSHTSSSGMSLGEKVDRGETPQHFMLCCKCLAMPLHLHLQEALAVTGRNCTSKRDCLEISSGQGLTPGLLREPSEDSWGTWVGTSRVFLGSGLPCWETDGLGASHSGLREPLKQSVTLAAQELGSNSTAPGREPWKPPHLSN